MTRNRLFTAIKSAPVWLGLTILFTGLASLGPIVGWGSETQFWQVGDFDEFLSGNLEGVSLSHDGSLSLAPPAEAFFDPEEALALSLAADSAGRLYVGTGHEGKVFRVEASGQSKLLFQAPESEILALTAGPDGAIYAASSPEGKVYRITPDGKSSVFFDPKAKYIWSLAFDSGGRLYAGTGDGGLIYQIDSTGKGRVFFESRQTHIICLAFDRKGNLLAGSDPDGLVYRISPEGKGFVLYKADFPEIHALALDSEGRIYAAALGGAGSTPSTPFLAPQTPAVPQPGGVTTITVTASGGNEPEAPAANGGQQPAPQPPSSSQRPSGSRERTSPSFSRATAAPFSVPSAPQGHGALVRIGPDNSTETLWSSDKESIFGLALVGRDVLFSTDSHGRIFRLGPSADGERLTLVTETRESLATRLLVENGNLYVATSNVGKLFRVGAGPAREGAYESPVKDAKFVSRWGDLSWRAQVPAGCSIKFYSRSGNSERPDSTWSNWAGPYSSSEGSPITSPAARYIQWKAAFTGPGGPDGSSPSLEDVTVAYLNQNLPPQIQSLDISTGGNRTSFAAGALSGASTQGVGISGGAGFGGGGTVSEKKTPVTITWRADDPNGDSLVYSLYLKASDERDWHLLKGRLRDSSYTVDADAVPDGEYVARLEASDEESNPPALARRSELVSAPFWIDNTPPRVEVTGQRLESSPAEVTFRATSNLSPLRAAEVSVDGGEWKPVAADDGIIDSRSETFTVRLPSLEAGEHRVALRAFNIAGNTGIGKAVLRLGAR